jgi:hypothetical protein
VRMKLATLQLPGTKSILAKPTCSCETQIRNCTEEGSTPSAPAGFSISSIGVLGSPTFYQGIGSVPCRP